MTLDRQIDESIAPDQHRRIVKALLDQRLPVTFRASGPSMTPTLRNGDQVEIRPLSNEPLRPGNIVLFTQHDRLTLHRYTGRSRDNNLLRMVADAALSGCEWTERKNVHGVATIRIRNGRRTRLDTHWQCWWGLLRCHARPARKYISFWIMRNRFQQGKRI